MKLNRSKRNKTGKGSVKKLNLKKKTQNSIHLNLNDKPDDHQFYQTQDHNQKVMDGNIHQLHSHQLNSEEPPSINPKTKNKQNEFEFLKDFANNSKDSKLFNQDREIGFRLVKGKGNLLV